jgi:hypothetical protein
MGKSLLAAATKNGAITASQAALCWGLLSNKEGTWLARGSGSVFGFDPRLYRAEGHGAKAGILFMIQCFLYCHQPIPKGQLTFYCDNEGLLKKLTYLRSYTNAVHATCLHSEWDIISSVH